MRFFDIAKPSLDSTRQMFLELESDERASKIDLGIGIYRDENGLAPIFKSVKNAEKILFEVELGVIFTVNPLLAVTKEVEVVVTLLLVFVVTTCKTLPVVIDAGKAVIADIVLLFGLIIAMLYSNQSFNFFFS